MAEKKDKEKAEGAGKSESTPQLNAKREQKKSRWTLALCKKFAKRFHSVDEWKTGSPSCYKAAESRGWVKECSALMTPSSKPVKARPAKPAVKTTKPKKTKAG
jgi:hypothetical protein